MAYIQEQLQSLWNVLQNLFAKVQVSDVLDVVIVTLLVYELIILVRNTRAQQLAVGMLLLVLSSAIANVANMRTLSYFLDAIMNVGIIVLAIIFQPELRRALEQVGGVNNSLSRIFRAERMDDSQRAEWEKAIVAICDGAENMAETRTGALIVIERRTNLDEIIRTGTPLNSVVNVETLGTIFYEGTPLHDGAVVVRNARVASAGCFLPLSNNLEISKDMGTRHRSALGMSENSDAVVVVVSEETGIISLAKSGVMIRRLDRQNLFNLLVSEVIPPEQEAQKQTRAQRLRAFFTKRKEGQREQK